MGIPDSSFWIRFHTRNSYLIIMLNRTKSLFILSPQVTRFSKDELLSWDICSRILKAASGILDCFGRTDCRSNSSNTSPPCLISVLVIAYNVTSRKHNPSLFNPVELRIILIAMSLLSFRFGLLFITMSLHKVNVGLEWISNEVSLSKVWICFALASISAISRLILDNPKHWVCLPILSLKMHPFSFF